MYDIAELERKWKRYRIRRVVLPIAIAVLLIFGALLLYFFILPTGSNKFAHTKEDIGLSKRTIVEKAPQKQTKNELNVLFSPPFGQIQVVKKEQTQEVIDMPVEQVVDIPIIDEGDLVEKPSVSHRRTVKHTPVVSAKKTQQKKKLKLKVSSPAQQSVLKQIEKRFYRTKDPNDALFLAKKYYDKGMYAVSSQWAKRANDISPDLEESWLIFAKAKAKAGYKAEALRVLRAYIDKTGSQKAIALLRRMHASD